MYSRYLSTYRKKKIIDRLIYSHHTPTHVKPSSTCRNDRQRTIRNTSSPYPCQKHVLHPESSRLHLNPQRGETVENRKRSIAEQVYRMQHERMLISLFKYHWWRSRVSSISHCHRLSTPCASSFSSLPDETLFLPLLLLPPPLAKKAVSPTSRVESSPTVSPGRFLYFPVFLPRLLLGPVNYEEGEGHEIRAGGFISPRVSPFLPTFTGARADFSIASKGTRPGEKENGSRWIWIGFLLSFVGGTEREGAVFLGSFRIFFFFSLCEFLL